MKNLLSALGSKRKRKKKQSPDPYHTAILSLLASKGKAHVVVVGANDGKIADPVFDLIHDRLRDVTSMTLFEPQSALIPYLEANYAFHEDCTIINKAIGPDSELTLYSIRPEDWPKIKPRYAKDWPVYRAPTGGTSTDRNRVVAFAKKYISDDDKAQEAVISQTVPSVTLAAALSECGRDAGVDVLQVDAEGFDDQVILNANLERFTPAIVRFESRVIPEERMNKLRSFMENLGYVFLPMGIDTLCIRAFSGQSSEA